MKDILLFDFYGKEDAHQQEIARQFCGGRHLNIISSTLPDLITDHLDPSSLNYDIILCIFHNNAPEYQLLSWTKHCVPHIPKLAIGTSRDYQMARSALLAGADDYLHQDDLLTTDLNDFINTLQIRHILATNQDQALPGSKGAQNRQTEEVPPGLGKQFGVPELGVILKAKSYIHQHFMEHTLSLGQVSQYVCLSEKHFSTLFSKACHTTFSSYLMYYRMEKAKTLLLLSEERVYQIALQVGYSSVEHFSRYFKKYTGKSPEQFRR